MSLVVLSNRGSDASVSANTQNIFKPYSFRNDLSSQMELPANCQVALQSVKFGLDGSLQIGLGQVLYGYFGEVLNIAAGDTMNDSTAWPVRIPLIQGVETGRVKNITFDELVGLLKGQLNKFVYHPNLIDGITVAEELNASGARQGIKVEYNFNFDDTSSIPANATAIEFGNNRFNTGDAGWEYTEGEFLTTESTDANIGPACAILTEQPISLIDGSLEVDFLGAGEGPAMVDWGVGLGRWCNPGTSGELKNKFAPNYFSFDRQATNEGPDQDYFADFLVHNRDGILKLSHATYDSEICEELYWRDVPYDNGTNGSIASDYNLSDNPLGFNAVKFTTKGQKIKIEMMVEGTPTLLYEYNKNENDIQLKPINQACWTMYPILNLARTPDNFGESLIVTEFIGIGASRTDNPDVYNGDNNSWYNAQLVGQNGGANAWSLERRPWNDQSTTDKSLYNVQAGIAGGGANRRIALANGLITKQSSLYTPTVGANTARLLAMNNSLTNAEHPANREIISAIPGGPVLATNKSMFVRLDNFTGQSMNGFGKNRSSIIAHVPMFDSSQETSRVYHEPSEMIYIDLHNPNPIKISSFDISFCHVNEQYAENMAGQTIACLHFREKSK